MIVRSCRMERPGNTILVFDYRSARCHWAANWSREYFRNQLFRIHHLVDVEKQTSRFEKKLGVALDWALDLLFTKDLVQFQTVRAPTISHMDEADSTPVLRASHIATMEPVRPGDKGIRP